MKYAQKRPLLREARNRNRGFPRGIKIKESEFYEPFAEWLMNDLDEVTEVASLGCAGLKSKWETPDVVGIYNPLASNLIKFPIEIVSAEIKIDPAGTRNGIRSGGSLSSPSCGKPTSLALCPRSSKGGT